jgi:S-adenosylmethionine hydrolase
VGARVKPPIVLLTDFGGQDPYVGVMKGVILAHAPGAQLVDLCHEVPPQDVRGAAFQLMVTASFFPKGTLFVAVVDPGVGSRRRILWARTARHQFLAPDNGVLSWLEDAESVLEIREVTNRKLWLPVVSSTFHGRDVFAPVAGRLHQGLEPRLLGPQVRVIVRLPFPGVTRGRGGTRGEILSFDRFGNAITNLRRGDVKNGSRITFRGRALPRAAHYGEAARGKPAAVIGSAGFLELSVREGDFRGRYKAKVGDPVESRG